MHAPELFTLTATPYKNDCTYTEILPCKALLPFVRCFWGSKKPYIVTKSHLTGSTIIPDACVDLIYSIDYTANKISAGFCGVNDQSFFSQPRFCEGHLSATFAIRFYAWNVYKFSEDSLKNTANGFLPPGACFSWLDRQLCHNMFDLETLNRRAEFAQNLLLQKLYNARQNINFDAAMNYIIFNKGNTGIFQLAEEMLVSTRQLERIFAENLGLSPKKIASLVRYQFLWNKILREPDFNVLDAVYELGFTDQSHLLHEFKKFHTTDIGTAKRTALLPFFN